MLAAVATGSFAIPSNEPAPLLGTEAQAGPNWAIIEGDIDGAIDGEPIGMLDEEPIGAELGVAAVLLQAASGISRAAPRPRIVVEVRMAV
ncbi:MAG TPA: hypothetical protein PKE46_00170, partial [Micropruina sp.]|nr:hypothetical protein [Micropruina sp.]